MILDHVDFTCNITFLGQPVFPEEQPVIVALARAAFVLAGFFPLPLSSSSSSPHS
jgi:hypothetical protein